MTNNTRLLIRMLVSALVSGMITSGGILLQSISESGEVKKGAIVIACITGTVMMLKDVQSYLSQPPVFMVEPPPKPLIVPGKE